MWSMQLTEPGLEGLAEIESPRPAPGPHEVLVRVRAMSINYRDLALIRGDYGSLGSYPIVPISDGAGEIVETGADVTRFQVGDRVIFSMRPEWKDGAPTRREVGLSLGLAAPGVASEYRTAGESEIVRTPSNLTDVEAATLPIAAVTAWTALVTRGNLRADQSVVIQGTGGVSIFALQFASHVGAKTIVLSRSDEKLERARLLGASHLINTTRTPDWHDEVVRLTEGEGADHVLDVGGGETLARSLDALRPGGNLYLVGFLGGATAEIDLTKVFRRVPNLMGLSVGPISSFERMNEAIEKWKLKPVVDRVYERGDVREALEYMATGSQFGKIAITI